MFVDFFFLLRKRGLPVSLNEWMTLLEGMKAGLHQSSLTGFYYLARAILVRDESDYDKFDQAFLEYFKDVEFKGDLPDEFMEWLNNPTGDFAELRKEMELLDMPAETMDEILALIEQRLREQDAEHNGGNKWIGTHGYTAFGNAGWHPHGVRIGGESMYKTARSVAGERKFRDFRKDNVLDTRAFQMAFRTLRSMSIQTDTAERELDIDGTIQDTADNAGKLKLRYRPPRRNSIKILMMMDSGGSMQFYSKLCSMLFQAATKSNHFKELHTYYFHNCVYDELYTDPSLRPKFRVPIDWILNNFGEEYRLIIVGDAMMDPYELWGKNYDWRTRSYSDVTGMDRMKSLKRKYPHCVWLNPEPMPKRPGYWDTTHMQLAEEFKMYDLTAEGIEGAMKYLTERHG